MSNDAPLLEIEDLSIAFTQYTTGLRQHELKVIRDLSIKVRAGEMVAIVGASGSGKSLLAHAILGILPNNAICDGKLLFKGEDLTAPGRQAQLRGSEIAFVPQSVACLDPLMRVGKQVKGPRGTMEKVRSVFKRFGLKPETEQMYPFQLSGGMARRVLVSTAVIEDAELIVADEPTPGLTHALAVDALKTFREFANEGKGVLLITHDLDLAYEACDSVVVFYAGTTLEITPAEDFRNGPDTLRHPFSKALWQALPQNGFKPTPGTQPYAGGLENACPYAERCNMKTGECVSAKPPLRELRGGYVRCVHAS